MGDKEINHYFVYHGSQRWDGFPEVREGKRKRTEAGPGIYTTTSYQRAKKYSKGGGKVLKFSLDKEFNFLNEFHFDLSECLECISLLKRPGKDKVKDMVERLNENLIRRKKSSSLDCVEEKEKIAGNVLLNLLVNGDFLIGKNAVFVAEWFTKKGVDGHIENQYNNEDWVVIFNPGKIKKFEKVIEPRHSYPEDFVSIKEQKKILLSGCKNNENTQIFFENSDNIKLEENKKMKI